MKIHNLVQKYSTFNILHGFHTIQFYSTILKNVLLVLSVYDQCAKVPFKHFLFVSIAIRCVLFLSYFPNLERNQTYRSSIDRLPNQSKTTHASCLDPKPKSIIIQIVSSNSPFLTKLNQIANNSKAVSVAILLMQNGGKIRQKKPSEYKNR